MFPCRDALSNRFFPPAPHPSFLTLFLPSDDGLYEINAQSFDISVRSRLPIPLPADLLAHTDFDAVFVHGATAVAKTGGDDDKHFGSGSGDGDNSEVAVTNDGDASLMCTQISSNTHRRWLSVTRNEVSYDLHMWRPLDTTSEYLLPDEVLLIGPVPSVAEIDASYRSHGYPRKPDCEATALLPFVT